MPVAAETSEKRPRASRSFLPSSDPSTAPREYPKPAAVAVLPAAKVLSSSSSSSSSPPAAPPASAAALMEQQHYMR